jgi:hypothetical protein
MQIQDLLPQASKLNANNISIFGILNSEPDCTLYQLMQLLFLTETQAAATNSITFSQKYLAYKQ